jgi:hypothetical protein
MSHVENMLFSVLIVSVEAMQLEEADGLPLPGNPMSLLLVAGRL